MFKKIIINFIVVVFCLSLGATVFAVDDTTPEFMIYEGRLLNSGAIPISAEHVFRFSFWKSGDWTSSDKNLDGSISVFALNFGGWQEVQSIDPYIDGTFSARLGSVSPFSEIIFDEHKFLQVEIKPVGAPDTDYQLMDPTGDAGADANDRQVISTTPYAKNSERLDNKEIGTSIGNIALVGPNDKWDPDLIPGQTQDDSFIIDGDDSVVGGSIGLQFGSLLGKILSYDLINAYFNFNDDVNIEGDLTVTGTINGVTVGPYDQSIVIEPEYEDSVMQLDGTDNKGKLEVFYEDADGVPGNENYNYYLWTTTKATMQDDNLILRIQLPEGFVSWQATPIQFVYKTLDANVANNYLELTVEDSNGAAVGLVGANNLVSTTWSEANISFSTVSTWTAGTEITLSVKMVSTSIGSAFAGRIKLNYNGK